MADLHIHDFYKDCGLILIALYNHFPRPITLYVEDISGPDNIDQYGLHSERHLSCLGAILWLAEEGYIRYQQQVKQEAFDGCGITHKTLRLLTEPQRSLPSKDQHSTESSLPPSQRQERNSRINRLRSAIEARDSTATAAIARDLLFHGSEHHD
ncbi:hypothetical protein EDC56_0543 [Sinobacterium caligoides]|uniref:Uncharacterized protein n=1 Tax=Sinobacterium caligoides TaxID=933926 RepID=A0A3N2DYT7_9GAMM|nr:hypothetical protein [Sinobacterium caligoides]ROS05021.1 hypothetical protein EDC56_0543 [Sinobacterium caligoides]